MLCDFLFAVHSPISEKEDGCHCEPYMALIWALLIEVFNVGSALVQTVSLDLYAASSFSQHWPWSSQMWYHLNPMPLVMLTQLCSGEN
jgi:hypothetical protein